MPTPTAVRPPSGATTLQALLNAVRAQGLRVSTARRVVLEALVDASRPLTAEEVAGARYDLGSVYRNLETLESIGLVHHVHLGHAAGRYELSGRDTGWATCQDCGSATPLGSEALAGVRAAVRDAIGFDPSFSHFPLVGRCPDCRS